MTEAIFEELGFGVAGLFEAVIELIERLAGFDKSEFAGDEDAEGDMEGAELAGRSSGFGQAHPIASKKRIVKTKLRLFFIN